MGARGSLEVRSNACSARDPQTFCLIACVGVTKNTLWIRYDRHCCGNAFDGSFFRQRQIFFLYVLGVGKALELVKKINFVISDVFPRQVCYGQVDIFILFLLIGLIK